MILQYLAVLWAVWWFGLVLICLRDDNELIFKELSIFLNSKGIYSLISALAILLLVPLTIPYSITHILLKWMRKK
jgi:hypothetical protein